MNDVLVLHAAIPDGPPDGLLGRLHERLPYARRVAPGRSDELDRCASLAGLWLALSGAARLLRREVGPGELAFASGRKPVLANGPFFSVSHGAVTVAVALCTSFEVGLDLEDLDASGRGGRGDRARLERWTATEAVLKAAGRGLRDAGQVELRDDLKAGTLLGQRYALVPLALRASCVAHLAAASPVGAITVEERELPGS
jgi:phosphopantetheinyl transferase